MLRMRLFNERRMLEPENLFLWMDIYLHAPMVDRSSGWNSSAIPIYLNYDPMSRQLHVTISSENVYRCFETSLRCISFGSAATRLVGLELCRHCAWPGRLTVIGGHK